METQVSHWGASHVCVAVMLCCFKGYCSGFLQLDLARRRRDGIWGDSSEAQNSRKGSHNDRNPDILCSLLIGYFSEKLEIYFLFGKVERIPHCLLASPVFPWQSLGHYPLQLCSGKELAALWPGRLHILQLWFPRHSIYSSLSTYRSWEKQDQEGNLLWNYAFPGIATKLPSLKCSRVHFLGYHMALWFRVPFIIILLMELPSWFLPLQGKFWSGEAGGSLVLTLVIFTETAGLPVVFFMLSNYIQSEAGFQLHSVWSWFSLWLCRHLLGLKSSKLYAAGFIIWIQSLVELAPWLRLSSQAIIYLALGVDYLWH